MIHSFNIFLTPYCMWLIRNNVGLRKNMAVLAVLIPDAAQLIRYVTRG